MVTYNGFEIDSKLQIWKDGQQMFEAIPCRTIADCEILIDSYLIAQDVTDKFWLRFPNFSQVELTKLL